MIDRTRPTSYGQSGAPQLTVVSGAAPAAQQRRLTTRAERLGKQSLLERVFPTFFAGGESVSKIELAMFSRQLATFMGAGVPITQAFAVIAEETRSKPLRRVLRRVLEDLSEGLSVAESFMRYPKLFGPLYVNMVRAAELTGNLAEVLRRLDQHLTREDAVSKKIRNAVSYPIVVLIMAAIAATVLVTFVLPRFQELFAEFKAELPLTTQILLGFSTFLTTQRVPLLIGAAALVAILLLSQQFEAGRYVRDAIALRLPVIGTLGRYAAVARFARTLSTMLAAGVPIARSFDIVIASAANRVIQRRLRPVKERLLAGEGFAGPLGEARVFPPMVVQMVRVGEETGSLERFLSETADYYEGELEYRLAAALALLEPAIMIIVGAVVGFVAISLVSAVYALTQSIR